MTVVADVMMLILTMMGETIVEMKLEVVTDS